MAKRQVLCCGLRWEEILRALFDFSCRNDVTDQGNVKLAPASVSLSLRLCVLHILFVAGGEFGLTEQQSRRQSRVEVLTPETRSSFQFIIDPFAARAATTGPIFRHGVSTVRSGKRYTLGIIFHDAK